MAKVRVFLKTDLFAVGGDLRIVPDGTSIVDGQLIEQSAGGLLIQVETWRKGDGKETSGPSARLLLPGAKVDYTLFLE